jgi:hypothetical protein
MSCIRAALIQAVDEAQAMSSEYLCGIHPQTILGEDQASILCCLLAPVREAPKHVERGAVTLVVPSESHLRDCPHEISRCLAIGLDLTPVSDCFQVVAYDASAGDRLQVLTFILEDSGHDACL